MPLLAALLAATSLSSPAAASASDFGACSAAATTAQELKRCGTFRADRQECRSLRPVGEEAPAVCMEAKVVEWRAVLEQEEQSALSAGVRDAAGFDAWSQELRALCRDEEELRLSTERYGPAHAAFEAATCELRSTIRRVVETNGMRRGF
ncbi:MAG: hypothetical protein AAFS07_02430 [Pseudomonadota bacterium]